MPKYGAYPLGSTPDRTEEYLVKQSGATVRLNGTQIANAFLASSNTFTGIQYFTSASGIYLGTASNIELFPGDPSAGPGGNAFNGGIVDQIVTGNFQVSAYHLEPTSGTAPTWGPISEFVSIRVGGTDFQRISFTSMAAWAGPALNDAAIDYRIQAESGGSATLLPIKFTQQQDTLGTYYEYLTLAPGNDGNIRMFRRTDSPGLTADNLSLTLGQQKRTASNVLTGAGTQNSPQFILEGNSYDSSLHTVYLKQYVEMTSNAGAATWHLQYKLDSGSYVDLLQAASSGIVSVLQINATTLATATLSATSVAYTTTLTGTSTNASALAIGRQGATNPVLQVDASTATVATGFKIKGAAAAGGLALSVITSGTNESLTIDAAGSGTITVGGTSTGAITLSRATSALSLNLTGSGVPPNGINLSAANTLSLYNNSLETLRLQAVASAVNYAYIKGAATGGGGNRVSYGAAGSDTDVSIDFIAQGAGNINFNARGSNAGGIMRLTSGTAAAANGLNITSAAATAAPTIAATDLGGTGDTNIGITISPLGTGLLQLGNSASFSANNTVATVLGSVGPTGSHTTVQKWLTVRDSGGTILYIPAF